MFRAAYCWMMDAMFGTWREDGANMRRFKDGRWQSRPMTADELVAADRDWVNSLW